MKIIPIIKSVLIIALAVLAVYQVGRLWFVNFTDRNFVLYLEARFPPSAPDGQSAFAQPFRIVSGAGDGLFSIRYSDIAASEEWAFGESVLDAILRHGDFRAFDEISLAEIFSRPVLVYEYAFAMCSETFVRALGHRNAALLTDADVTAFRSIAVPLVSPYEPVLQVFFINGLQIWEFSLPLHGGSRYTPADFDFFVERANVTALHFVWEHSGFAPRVAGDGFSYAGVVVENPFRDAQGLFTLPHIRSRVEPLFDNPASIFPSVSVDKVYTFSNRNTMVRYLENAVLEYTSYRTIGRAAQENFMTDFSVALAFVNADPFAINEMYLKNHGTRGRAHVFYFNYVIDNRPLVLTQPWQTRANCTEPLLAPIEITVDQGRVIRYRRLVYTFRTDGVIWKSADELAQEEHFTLGFPIGSGPNLELQVLR